MKINKIAYIFMILWLTNCQSQIDRIETKIFDCITQSYPNNGENFKRTIQQLENHLIEQNILKDRTGKSYREIYKMVSSGAEIVFEPSKEFTDSIRSINKYYFERFLNCEQKYMNSESYINSKTNKLRISMDSLKKTGGVKTSGIANEILNILDEKDFELEYYKFRTIQIVNLLGVDFSIRNKKNEFLIGDTENALRIYINKDNDVFVNDKKVNIEQLRHIITEYENENKSESKYLIKADREALYKTYIEVNNVIKDEISTLRNNLAIEKYNMDYSQLSDEQKKEISNTFPWKVKDQ